MDVAALGDNGRKQAHSSDKVNVFDKTAESLVKHDVVPLINEL